MKTPTKEMGIVMTRPEATLRGQATAQLRDAALWLRFAHKEDRDGYEESADGDRKLAALAWLRREALIAAHRQLVEIEGSATVRAALAGKEV